jgi:nucleotide-binding universal stress UspA family protein
MLEQAASQVDTLLESLKKDAARLGVLRVTAAKSIGPPVAEIVRFAREGNYDLIVLGTHGRTGLKHALIGSVAERVVRHAHCPVLTIRPATLG